MPDLESILAMRRGAVRKTQGFDEEQDDDDASSVSEACDPLLPSIDAISHRFKKSAYALFCQHILICVSGKKQFDNQARTKKLSYFVGVSDEAYALLLLENHWERYEDYANQSPIVAMHARYKSKIKPKFTLQDGNNKKFKGWSQEGIKRFNQLVQEVEQDRQSKEGKQFEISFQHHMLNVTRGSKHQLVKDGMGDEEADVDPYVALTKKKVTYTYDQEDSEDIIGLMTYAHV